MIYFCLGRRLQGKTTLAYFIAKSSAACRVVFDPRGQIRPVETNGSRIVTTPDELVDAITLMLDDKCVEIIFTPDGDVAENFEAFTRCAKLLVTKTRKSCAILIDEVRFADAKDRSLDWILRCSPVDSVHVLFTGHRPKDIPTDIRSIADRWLLFKFSLPHDFAIIEEQTSPGVANAVRKLGPRQFVEWDDALERCRFFNNSAKWFVAFERPAIERVIQKEPLETEQNSEEIRDLDNGNLFE